VLLWRRGVEPAGRFPGFNGVEERAMEILILATLAAFAVPMGRAVARVAGVA
jgi:hypothetical protein